MRACLLLLGLGILLASCGGSKTGSDGGDGGGNEKPHAEAYVNWEAVPSKYNPTIKETALEVSGIEKINVDAFGFERDVEVVYSKDLSQTKGLLRLFLVCGAPCSGFDIDPKFTGKSLSLVNYGNYKCEIRIQNGEITALQGSCYVRVQIVLPVGAEIEVYNLGHLISQRFMPMDNETLLARLDHESWDKEKLAVIEEYLASYSGAKKPSLTSAQLGLVMREFPFKDGKLKALRSLHEAVSDRQNLGAMIENEFSSFDREEARKIVGIN